MATTVNIFTDDFRRVEILGPSKFGNRGIMSHDDYHNAPLSLKMTTTHKRYIIENFLSVDTK